MLGRLLTASTVATIVLAATAAPRRPIRNHRSSVRRNRRYKSRRCNTQAVADHPGAAAATYEVASASGMIADQHESRHPSLPGPMLTNSSLDQELHVPPSLRS
jgi:hypothetical protein